MDVAAQDLAHAIPLLLDRSLYHSAKWASELLSSCNTDVNFREGSKEASPSLHCSNSESVQIMLGQSFAGLRQYHRAVNALSNCTSPLAIFIRIYSQFLLGEKCKAEEQTELSDPRDKSQVANKELVSLRDELSGFHSRDQLDGFGLYVFGLVLKNLDLLDAARDVLVESVNAFPCNWSAWKTLSSLVPDRAVLTSLPLRGHWMVQFFLADVHLELHNSTEALDIVNDLQQIFPNDAYILSQMALIYYNDRDFDRAQDLFEELRESDPHRLEQMDTYSNILFVKESKGSLSYLAHNAVKIDKYCPETCCIIGNYYSLRCEHEKAVLYFQRALKLNPNYLSAWTLMGHEYVELRNTNAAINAYRRAVDINAKDYRAWYGLGQTYELLQMHTYALYYFGKATHVRPFDPRMWCAMADSYEKLDLIDDAIRCFKRAESNNDREGIALSKLAKLYAATNEPKKVVERYDQLHCNGGDDEEGSAPASVDIIDPLLFLAQYHKASGDLTEADRCCTRLLETSASEEAKSIQKEIHQLRSSSRCQNSYTRSSEDYSMSMSP